MLFEARGRSFCAGWSAGAGLTTLAAASPSKQGYAGLIAIGLGESNILAWSLVDTLTYITKKQPDEPTYSVLPYLSQVAPLPLVMLQSTGDEYVPRGEARRLFAAAAEPKRLVEVTARDHRFGGGQAEFLRQLKDSLEWVAAGGPRLRPDER